MHLIQAIQSLFMTEDLLTGLRQEAIAASLIGTLSPYNQVSVNEVGLLPYFGRSSKM